MALRSGCTPGMAGASKALKLLLFDGGDWADPEVRKFRFFSRPLLLLGRPPCGPALGGGAGAITARAHPISDPSCNQEQKKSGVPGVDFSLPHIVSPPL